MTIKALYPTVRPTLNLDFAKTKALDPRITFTRASTATFVGSNGLIQTAASGAARFDHDPATGESLGLLVEEARTNAVTYSEQFDNAAWAKDNCTVTANSVAAPNNTATADKIVSANSTAFTGVSVAVAGSTAGTYTFSVFAKAAEATRIQLLWNSGVSSNYANFNLSTGAVTAGTYINASITAFGSGWYKCSITSSTTAIWAYVSLSNSDTATRAAAYSGNGTNGVQLWGAQIEAGAFPTSYIPTTTATVTRAADVASMTGTNFSSWYNQIQGTMLCSWRSNRAGYGGANPNYGILGIGGNDNGWQLLNRYSSNFDLLVQNAGADIALLDVYNNAAASIPQATPKSFAFAYAVDNFATSRDGLIVGTDTSGTHNQSVNNMLIGSSYYLSRVMTGTIARLSYYPVRLANTQLQNLTAT